MKNTSWLAQLLEAHPELALDSEEDRARLCDLIEAAFPRHALVDALRGSMLAVCKVRRARGEIVSTVDVHAMADELARNSTQGAMIVLGLEAVIATAGAGGTWEIPA